MKIAGGRRSDDGFIPAGMLDVRVRREGERWRVTLRGELVMETVDGAEKELARLVPDPVVLDLSGVSFIDSMGMTVLVRYTKLNVVLQTTSGEVDRLIRLCGLEAELQPPDSAAASSPKAPTGIEPV